MKTGTTLLSIQYLRALAALVVVVAHVGWLNPLWGQQGVDLFFVISGFIMMHVSVRETRPAAFLRARALRVAPLCWVVTLAWVALHPELDIVHVLQSLAFIPHKGPEHTVWPVIWQGWTLLYEAFFYVAFAAALLLSRRFMLPILTLSFVVLALAGWLFQSNTLVAQVYLSPLLLEFIAGAWLHRAWQRGWLGRTRLTAIAITTGTSALLLARNIDFGSWRIIGWGVPCLMLVAGGLGLEPRLPRLNLLILLGNASYATYLTHRFVISGVRSFLPSPDVIRGILPSAMALSGIVLGCAAIGIVVHVLIELPIAQAFKHQRRLAKSSA